MSSRVDTLRLGSLTKAMKATQRPMPMKSIRAQWPVTTQTQTTRTEMLTDISSARVNLPHMPSEILPFLAQGLTRYWHIGSRRKARAMVAITAVQTANRSCIESKKKNMMRREREAPRGRHMACRLSMVVTLVSFFSTSVSSSLPLLSSMASDRKEP